MNDSQQGLGTDVLLDTSALQRMLGGVDRRTIDRWFASQGLPRFKVGGRNLYRLSEVRAWLDQCVELCHRPRCGDQVSPSTMAERPSLGDFRRPATVLGGRHDRPEA